VSSKKSGTHVRFVGDGHEPPQGKRGTQILPLPPRPREKDPAGSASGTAGVVTFATVAVESAAPSPERRAPGAANRAVQTVHPATRIFSVSALASAPRSKERSPTLTFAAPSFSLAPAGAGAHAPIAPRSKTSLPSAAAVSAPLLRAFEDGLTRTPTWSTAQTLNAPLPRAENGQSARAPNSARATATAAVSQTARGEAKALPVADRQLSARQLFRQLSEAVAAAPRISVVLAGGAVVLCLGSFVGRGLGRRVVVATASAHAVTPLASTASVASARPEPERTQPDRPLPEPPMQDLRTRESSRRDALASPRHPLPLALSSSAPHELTLARQAVDALLAGDRPRALQLYGELARRSPDRDAYREAVRLLSPPAESAPSRSP
jgi:hypothetical protein